jgi:hypothetical protein
VGVWRWAELLRWHGEAEDYRLAHPELCPYSLADDLHGCPDGTAWAMEMVLPF